jgi:hypothetical protein
MTTTIPQLRSIDFARPLGGLEHLVSLSDQRREAKALSGDLGNNR